MGTDKSNVSSLHTSISIFLNTKDRHQSMGGLFSYFRGLLGSREMRILILGPYWRSYFTNTDAIIYVVDSADRDRVGISKQELVSMLEEDELKDAVLVVLANKQDIEGAMSVTEVHGALGLDKLKNRTFQIFKASATKGEGLDESMEWLSNILQNKK